MSNKQQGYTLIEILITIAIVSIIAGVTITTYLSAYRSYVASQILNQLQEDGERIMKQVERSVRSSVRAQVQAGRLILELDVDSLEYQQNGGCRTILYRGVMPSLNANGQIEVVIPGGVPSCALIGGGPLNSVDPVTGVSVEDVMFSVVDNAATNTQTVTISFTLRQGVRSATRTTYDVSLPMQSVITTRQYVR